MAVDGGDGNGIAQAQVIELVDVRVGGPTWSILLTASTTGPGASSMLATSWSEAVRPVLMSQTKTITVAFWMAISACSRMKLRISLSVPGSMPPVSTRSNFRLLHSASARRAGRGDAGVSSTMDSRAVPPAC